MSENDNSNPMTSRHGLSQDAQGRWWEMLSPTQQLTGQTLNKAKKTSRCHGNIKLQRFKRKSRKRGLTKDQIDELIQRRNVLYPTQGNDSSVTSNENNPNRTIKKIKKDKTSKKRKRSHVSNRNDQDVMKSLSQISISRPSKRKRKDYDKSSIHNDQR